MSKLQDELYTKAEIQITEADGVKGMLAVATTAVEDRHGEVVSVDGWDVKNFKKNPVLLWAHDHTIPAIGVAKNIKKTGEGKKAAWVFEPVFHDLTEQAKALKAMVEEGIINSFSVGFRPLEMDGNTYTKQELLEISLVNVPANPDARMLAFKSLKDKGFSDEVIKDVGAWVSEEVQDVIDVTAEKDAIIARLEQTVSKQGEQIDDLVKGLKHLNPQGRKSEVVTQRLALVKIAARAADKLLEDKPATKQANLAKVIKRASEKLIVDHKQELRTHGKN